MAYMLDWNADTKLQTHNGSICQYSGQVTVKLTLCCLSAYTMHTHTHTHPTLPTLPTHMHRYVSLMCDVKSEEQYYQQQDVVVLFSESTLRYVHTHTYKSQNSQNHSIVNMQAKRKPQVSIFVQLTLLQGNPSLN